MADNRTPYPEKSRQKIKAGMIMRKLHDHILGEAEMSATQIQAARILLGKVLPDMKAIEQTGTVHVEQTVINAQPESSVGEWANQHGMLSGSRSQDPKPH